MKDTTKKEFIEAGMESPSIKSIQILDHVVEMVYYQGRITFKLPGNVNVNELAADKKEELLNNIRKLQDDGTIYRLFGLPPQNTQLLPPSSAPSHLAKKTTSVPVGRPPLPKSNESLVKLSSSSLSPMVRYIPKPTTSIASNHHQISYTSARKSSISTLSPHESVIMGLSGAEMIHSLAVQKE
jgi:hypothetical protein